MNVFSYILLQVIITIYVQSKILKCSQFYFTVKNTNDDHFQHHLILKAKILPFCFFHIIISNIHGYCEKKMDALRHFPQGQICHSIHVKIAFLRPQATL